MVTAARPALYDVGRLPMLLVTSAMCYINLMLLSIVGLLLGRLLPMLVVLFPIFSLARSISI